MVFDEESTPSTPGFRSSCLSLSWENLSTSSGLTIRHLSLQPFIITMHPRPSRAKSCTACRQAKLACDARHKSAGVSCTRCSKRGLQCRFDSNFKRIPTRKLVTAPRVPRAIDQSPSLITTLILILTVSWRPSPTVLTLSSRLVNQGPREPNPIQSSRQCHKNPACRPRPARAPLVRPLVLTLNTPLPLSALLKILPYLVSADVPGVVRHGCSSERSTYPLVTSSEV